MKSKILISLLLALSFFSCLTLVLAIDWSPQGNITLKNRYFILNNPAGGCSGGQVVQGILANGYWNCTGAGAGDITGVLGDSYITNGSVNGEVALAFNETKMNATIIALSGSGGNASFNESSLIYLNVSGSNYWDNMTSINITQMEDNSGTLNLLESWLTTFINTFGFLTGNYFNQDLNITSNVSFGIINSSDWTNVSITESQITDLVHTTDTSSTVNCSGTQVLIANGSCQDVDTYFDDTDTTYLNGTGLSLISQVFSILATYRMPQGCSDGEIAEYNTTSLGWDCAVDNSAASGMASWVLAVIGIGGSESITDGETVSFSSNDDKYINLNRTTNIVNITLDETELNATISALASGGGSDGNASSICGDNEVLLGQDSPGCVGLNTTIDELDDDTTYTAGAGLDLGGTEFNHTDTSSQSSSDNSGNTFIQDIVLDTYGHITSIVTAVVSITNIFNQNLNQTSNVTFGMINSTDWTNVSITESQVSDLTHTTDTSAPVNCTGSENFLANGSCQDVDTYFDDTDTTINIFDQNLNTTNYVAFEGLNVSSHFKINSVNITCLNGACDWFANATDNCMYWPSGGKDCSV